MTPIDYFRFSEAGVYAGMPEDVYHADPVRQAFGVPSLSATRSRLLTHPSTPAHYRWSEDNPAPYKAAYEVGHGVHKLVLGLGSDIEVIHAENWRTKAAQEQRDEALAAGKIPLLDAQLDECNAMADAVLQHPIASLCFQGGNAEQSMFAQDPETSVWLRGRADYIGAEKCGRVILADLKTTNCADPTKWAKSAADYGYHRQAAWYCDLAVSLGLAKHATMVFVLVEKTPPYLVSTVELSPIDINRGRELNQMAIRIFAECLTTGKWPGYPEKIVAVELPKWATYQEQDILEEDANVTSN